jgi:hypothetical protein
MRMGTWGEESWILGLGLGGTVWDGAGGLLEGRGGKSP